MFRETCSSRDDLLDRLALHEKLAPDPRNRVHALHPPPPVRITKTGSLSATISRGSILDADPPPQGVKIARRITTRWRLGTRVRMNALLNDLMAKEVGKNDGSFLPAAICPSPSDLC